VVDSGMLGPALAVAVRAAPTQGQVSKHALAVEGSRERGWLIRRGMIDASGWRTKVARMVQGDICTCGGSMQIRPWAADGKGCCGHRREGRRCETVACQRKYPPACLKTIVVFLRSPLLALSLTDFQRHRTARKDTKKSIFGGGHAAAQRCQHQARFGPLPRG
jgi:hypothetical protein